MKRDEYIKLHIPPHLQRNFKDPNDQLYSSRTQKKELRTHLSSSVIKNIPSIPH